MGPGEYLYPSCTRVQRCSGCCSHPLLSCQPSHTRLLQLDVILVNTVNNTDRIVMVNMTEHEACECEYQCLCQCENWLERDLCSINNKLWDERSCSCRCRQT